MRTAEPAIETSVLRTTEEFRALAPEWNALLPSCAAATVFLTWAWQFAWWRHLGQGLDLALVTARDAQGTLRGIAPFGIGPERGIPPVRALRFLGTTAVSSEYLDVIAEETWEEPVAIAVWSALEEGSLAPDVIRWTDLLDSSFVLRRLIPLAARAGCDVAMEAGQLCPYLPLPSSWETLRARLGAKTRGNVARLQRKLEAAGIAIEEVAPNEAAECLQVLFRLHEARWNERGQSGNFTDPRVRAFHLEVAASLAPPGATHFFALRQGRETIGVLYALRYGKRMAYYQSGWSPSPPGPEWRPSDWSPGAALVAGSIERAIALGVEEYDFLRGPEPYKFHWAPDTRATRAASIVPPRSRRGRLRLRVERAEAAGRRAAKRLMGRVASPQSLRSSRADRVEWVSDLETMERLAQPWLDLDEADPDRTPFGGRAYILLWYRHYRGRLGQPLLGAAWTEGRLAALAPFVAWRGTLGGVPVRRLDLVGHNWGAGEIVLDPGHPEAAGALAGALVRASAFDVARVPGVREGSPLHACLLAGAEQAGLSVGWERTRHAVVDLSEGYDAYAARMSRNFRKKQRQIRQEIAGAGKTAVERIAAASRGGYATEEIGRAAERMFAIGDRSWKRAASGPMPEDHRRFYAEALRRFAESGMLDLSILTIDGQDAAFVLGLVERGCYYDFTISFDARFESLSPGAYLLQEVFRALPERGVRKVVSHGDHPYKERWATGYETRLRLDLHAPTMRAVLSRAARTVLSESTASRRRKGTP